LGKSLKQDFLKDGTLDIVRKLNVIAAGRGQSLAQMGASRPEQLRELVSSLGNRQFSAGELQKIDAPTLRRASAS
jgi:L-glyceraldehyde 3-phosphate reductase